MSKYWEKEAPVTVATNKNVVQYYEKSGKLSVARSPWTDDSGKERQGKTVCFDVAALLESGTDSMKTIRGILMAIIEQIDRQ